jgi:hypothetical protein
MQLNSSWGAGKKCAIIVCSKIAEAQSYPPFFLLVLSEESFSTNQKHRACPPHHGAHSSPLVTVSHTISTASKMVKHVVACLCLVLNFCRAYDSGTNLAIVKGKMDI